MLLSNCTNSKQKLYVFNKVKKQWLKLGARKELEFLSKNVLVMDADLGYYIKCRLKELGV